MIDSKVVPHSISLVQFWSLNLIVPDAAGNLLFVKMQSDR
jgi:hypothetical protein